MKSFLITAICAFIIVDVSYAQQTQPTFQSVTNAGNYTTNNVWIGMAPDSTVTENGLNLSGKLKLISYSIDYTTGTDANQPTIYRSGTRAGAYPFNNYDNLIFQTGVQNRDILFVTGATPSPKMVITGPGNVGIGTLTTGSSKLAVEGTITARRVRVTQSATWPDYVFDDGYQLLSLYEVEKYIKENKHLEGIPSAKTIENEHLDLGDMQAQLLKKLEEITLYMIELKRENDALKQEIELLKSK